MKGKLYLIPTTLGDSALDNVIPPLVIETINNVTHYIVENERTVRRYLLKLGYETSIDETTFYVLNKHTLPEEIEHFLSPLDKGQSVGLVSEAGIPCVADPGNIIVTIAHRKNIEVVPLTGPSSILLALMASGMNGQNFAFTGYLPINKNERIRKIKHLEYLSSKENQTQIFMETPYRNQKLAEDILSVCNGETRLCIACNITLKDEFIKTKTIKEWKKKLPDLNKKPTVFLLHG